MALVVLLLAVVSCTTSELLRGYQEVNSYEGEVASILTGKEKVGVEVVRNLLSDGEAHVLISLKLPQAAEGQEASQERINRVISQVQDSVLATLEPVDYRNRLRYTAVPALAGTLYTLKGLTTLIKHPNVIRIDIEVGGGGHE